MVEISEDEEGQHLNTAERDCGPVKLLQASLVID